MLLINNPLIPWRGNYRTWPNARVALTAIACIAPPSGLERTRRTPRARAAGYPLLSRRCKKNLSETFMPSERSRNCRAARAD
jgi:hypothetical protein